MDDKLIIRGISVRCAIGVLESERANLQNLSIDIELGIDVARAARRDDINDTIDYAQVADEVRGSIEDRQFRLLETVAEEISHIVLKKFEVSHCLVRVKKQALPGVDCCEIEIFRQKK